MSYVKCCEQFPLSLRKIKDSADQAAESPRLLLQPRVTQKRTIGQFRKTHACLASNAMGIAGVSLLFLGLQVSVTCVAPRVALTDSCSFFFPSGTSEPPVKFVYAHYFKAMTIAVACLWGRRSLGGEAQCTIGWQLCSFLGKDNEGMNVDPAVNIAHGFLVLSVKSWWGKKALVILTVRSQDCSRKHTNHSAHPGILTHSSEFYFPHNQL